MPNNALSLALDFPPFLNNIISVTSQLSTGNWGGTTPTSLENLIDSNITTSTTGGGTEGGGNKGWIRADLGSQISANSFLYFSLRRRDGFPYNAATFFIEGSTDNSSWTSLVSENISITDVETFYTRELFFNNYQWLRFGLADTGNGAAEIKGYEWRVYY